MEVLSENFSVMANKDHLHKLFGLTTDQQETLRLFKMISFSDLYIHAELSYRVPLGHGFEDILNSVTYSLLSE